MNHICLHRKIRLKGVFNGKQQVECPFQGYNNIVKYFYFYFAGKIYSHQKKKRHLTNVGSFKYIFKY